MKPGKGFRDWGTARNKMHLQVFSLMAAALLAGFGQGQGYMQTNRRKKKREGTEGQFSWGFTLFWQPNCLRIRRNAKSGQNLEPDSVNFNC